MECDTYLRGRQNKAGSRTALIILHKAIEVMSRPSFTMSMTLDDGVWDLSNVYDSSKEPQMMGETSDCTLLFQQMRGSEVATKEVGVSVKSSGTKIFKQSLAYGGRDADASGNIAMSDVCTIMEQENVYINGGGVMVGAETRTYRAMMDLICNALCLPYTNPVTGVSRKYDSPFLGSEWVSLVNWQADPRGRLTSELQSFGVQCLDEPDDIAGFLGMALIVPSRTISPSNIFMRSTGNTIDITLVSSISGTDANAMLGCSFHYTTTTDEGVQVISGIDNVQITGASPEFFHVNQLHTRPARS